MESGEDGEDRNIEGRRKESGNDGDGDGLDARLSRLDIAEEQEQESALPTLSRQGTNRSVSDGDTPHMWIDPVLRASSRSDCPVVPSQQQQGRDIRPSLSPLGHLHTARSGLASINLPMRSGSSPTTSTNSTSLNERLTPGVKARMAAFHASRSRSPIATSMSDYSVPTVDSVLSLTTQQPISQAHKESPSPLGSTSPNVNSSASISPTSPLLTSSVRTSPTISTSNNNTLSKRRGMKLSNMPTATHQSSPQNSEFSNFHQYLDAKGGSLQFAGKLVLHSKGVDFSSGKSFKIQLGDLEEVEEVGRGNYGSVHRVVHKPTNVTMAVKQIRLELDEAKLRTIVMELDVLHKAVSGYIVEFYGAFFVETQVFICMEYMDGGSIDKLYHDGVTEEVLAYVTATTVKGLKYLKDVHNIIHRDVKPTNVLINTKGEVKLCDFGVSGNLVASIAKTNIGCQSYMAVSLRERSIKS